MELNGEAPVEHQGKLAMVARFRRLDVFAVVLAVTLGLTACGVTGSVSPPVASVSTTTTSAVHGGTTVTTAPKANAPALLVEWASCMQSHGDPDQSDPTIDSHGGINIYISGDAGPLSGAVHNGTAPCNGYLAAASAALRAGVKDLTPPDQAALVQYSQCMRANGVPNYPDPGTGETTNLETAGIDPDSPFVERANNICGKKIHAPSWWISGAGPPGNISVQSGPNCSASGCPHPSDAKERTVSPGA
jgi:hypothetical protein